MEIVTQTIDTRSYMFDHIWAEYCKVVERREKASEIKMNLDLAHPHVIQISRVYDHIILTYKSEGKPLCEVSSGSSSLEVKRAINELLDKLEEAEGAEKKAKAFEKACYAAYQLDWMISHGHTLDELYVQIRNNMKEQMEEMVISNPYAAIPLLLAEASNEFIDGSGFGGELYVCKNEFLQSEFLDPDYMDHLLSLMPNSEEKKAYWKELIEKDQGVEKESGDDAEPAAGHKFKVGYTYRFGDEKSGYNFEAVCTGFTKSGKVKLQSSGMTSGKYPGDDDISEYDEITRKFTSEYKGAVKKFRVPKKSSLYDFAGVTRRTLIMASKTASLAIGDNIAAWIGRSPKDAFVGHAAAIGKLGNIALHDCATVNVVAPRFVLDESKVDIVGETVIRVK